MFSNILENNNFIVYEGQEINCEMFVTVHEFQSEFFFEIGSHCADIAPQYIDCEGNDICVDTNSGACNDFQQSSTNLGILGVAK